VNRDVPRFKYGCPSLQIIGSLLIETLINKNKLLGILSTILGKVLRKVEWHGNPFIKSMSSKSILRVDDEHMVLISLRDPIFNHFGDRYRCEMAESAAEAWEVIDELYAEDVRLFIVSDWLMPGIRGDKFLIQVHQRFPDIATVLLMGQANKTAIEQARQEADLYAYIAKPWLEETLSSTIKSELRQFYD
jgi:CheY-like chemotaxis protein